MRWLYTASAACEIIFWFTKSVVSFGAARKAESSITTGNGPGLVWALTIDPYLDSQSGKDSTDVIIGVTPSVLATSRISFEAIPFIGQLTIREFRFRLLIVVFVVWVTLS